MRRDMELVRKMVLAVEARPAGHAPALHIDGYDDAQVGYHAYLLVDSGLAAGFNDGDQGSPGPTYRITRLTSAGHDFAESARNEHIWDEVTEQVRKKGLVSATIDVFKKLLDKQIRRHLELE